MSVTKQRVHFIAIGGSVMHNLAIALKNAGYEVTGSDDKIFEPSRSKLEKYGVLPGQEGWFPEKLDNSIDIVILGMHAKADNPELLKAQELGLSISSFPEFIRDSTANKQRIVIGGSHGKTSICAMIMHVLKAVNKPFDYLVGASLEGFEVTVQLSDAPIMIIEGDEYLNSALDLRPKLLLYNHHIGVISGVRWDHYNVFPSLDEYVDAFEKFADATPKAGTLIYNGDDDITMVIGRKERDDVSDIEYVVHPFKIVDGVTHLITKSHGEKAIKVFGEHNMSNISAAKTVCEQIGVPDANFYDAISTFEGADRRLELVASNDDYRIYKDFAHAPSKVKASTNAVKSQFPSKHLIAALELHSFSSLNKQFLNQYADSMNDADEAIVYFNPEVVKHKKLEMLDAETIRNAFKNHSLKVFDNSQVLIDHLKSKSLINSSLLLMSSGNFDGLNYQELIPKN